MLGALPSTPDAGRVLAKLQASTLRPESPVCPEGERHRGYLAAQRNGMRTDGAATDGDPPWGGGRQLRRSGTWGREEVSESGCHHRGEESKRGGRDGESSGQSRRTRPRRTDPGWRTKEWDGQWCGRKKQGTAQHHKPSNKDRQGHGPDGIESGGRRVTFYHQHQSDGRECGT